MAEGNGGGKEDEVGGGDCGDSAQEGSCTHPGEPLEREFEADGEEEEGDADFGDDGDFGGLSDEFKSAGSDDRAGQEISDDGVDAEAFGDEP